MGFLLVMLIGLLTGAAAASLVVLGWAASQRRWLAAQCHQQITYWREEAERAKATAARLRGRLPGCCPVCGSVPVRGRR